LWLEFLNKIFNNDAELILFIKRFCGYCLTGDISEHCFLFLHGSGRNGKGVFCRTLLNVLGDDLSNTSPIEMFLEVRGSDRHPTELARLHKIRLTVAQETPKGRGWDEGKIKNMTGGDPIPGRFMRQDFFDFWPTFKLIIAGNNKPSLKLVDEAIRARLKLVPFPVKFPKAEQDPHLTEKLKVEGPEILRWMIDGCLNWQANGLGDPPAVVEASRSYFHDQDKVAAWLDERTERRQMAFTLTAELHPDWQAWCDEKGIDALGKTAFSKALQDRNWTYKKSREGGGFKDLVLKAKPAPQVDEPEGASETQANEPPEASEQPEAYELEASGEPEIHYLDEDEWASMAWTSTSRE
jgi:putative DNA primase/helicase